MNDKIIFITGITGFVGKNLSRYLSKNFDVHGISRQESKEFISYDILFNATLKYGAMIHLAGKAHDLQNNANDNEYYEVNFELTKQLYDAFLQSDSQIFIYVSSVKAVADTVVGILTEDSNPNPITAYGKSKKMAEDYILQNLPSDKKVYILRPCMIHGPGNKGNLNLLYNVVKKGIPYPLAAFDNRRSFLSIDNFNYLVGRILEGKDVDSGIYNFADDELLSTNELVYLISQVSGKKPKLFSVPKVIINSVAKLGDFLKLPINSESVKKLTENYCVSNQKIKTVLNIENLPMTAQQGLEKTIKSFMK